MITTAATNMPVDLGQFKRRTTRIIMRRGLIQDIVISGGGGPQQTGIAMQTQATADLLTLSTNITIAQTGQQAAVSNLLIGQEIPIPQAWTDTNGNSYFFDHTNDDGSAGVKVTFNIESAQTVGAQKLLAGWEFGF